MQLFNLSGLDRQWDSAVDGRKSSAVLWDSLDRKRVKQAVNRLQTRIVKAVKAGNMARVRILQRLLARSFAEQAHGR